MHIPSARGLRAAAHRPLLRVVLTGGPCSGKSLSLPHLSMALRAELGAATATVPEAATLLLSHGHHYPGMSGPPALLDAFEASLFRLQVALEDESAFLLAARLLHAPHPAPAGVLMMDRGLLDLKPYLPPEMWASLLARHGASEQALLQRYDLVLHLTTAADGAPAHYAHAGKPGCTNAHRVEPPEQAVALDRAVAGAWAAHPHRVVISNVGTRGFGDKLERTRAALLRHVRQNVAAAQGHDEAGALAAGVADAGTVEAVLAAASAELRSHSGSDDPFVLPSYAPPPGAAGARGGQLA
jgi:hypothetical protein